MGQVKMVVGGAGSSPIVYWDDMYVQIDTNAQGRLIQSVKTALRNPAYEGTEIFEQKYPVESLIAILLRQLRHSCMAELGEEVSGVVMGRPVKFSDDPEIDQRAQDKIESAAQLAGFEEIRFAPEPVAAAYMYHRQAPARQMALVFDFGGGTLDFTVMELGGSQPPRVLATHGVLVGGDDLDRAMMGPLKRYLGEGASLRNRQPFPAHLFQYLDSWQTMVLLSRPEHREVFRSARRGSDPEAIERLETLVTKNLGFKLFQGLEGAKIELSTNATAHLDMTPSGLKLRQMYTRPQFERLVTDTEERVAQGIDEVLCRAGFTGDEIQVVLRTGGSSEIPLFIRMLTQKFGDDRLRALSPFETIVGGLSIMAAES